ncbi:hypothetical protein JW796_02290 [Candidatus Dojkabacteria bacterium]|nr:hypothetical protein [Candidatus Dojkabacteria bacterium]
METGFDPNTKQARVCTQRRFYSDGKNIHGESGCGRCGACCVALGVPSIGKKAGDKCVHMTIEEGLASCALHEADKPPECKEWGCYGEGLPNALQRDDFLDIAIKIGTRTEEDIQGLISSF